MAEGTILWFSNMKGYGFIKQAEGGPDVFVHYTGINGNGYMSLDKGDRVVFDVEKSEKGLNAVNVSLSE